MQPLPTIQDLLKGEPDRAQVSLPPFSKSQEKKPLQSGQRFQGIFSQQVQVGEKTLNLCPKSKGDIPFLWEKVKESNDTDKIYTFIKTCTSLVYQDSARIKRIEKEIDRYAKLNQNIDRYAAQLKGQVYYQSNETDLDCVIYLGKNKDDDKALRSILSQGPAAVVHGFDCSVKKNWLENYYRAFLVQTTDYAKKVEAIQEVSEESLMPELEAANRSEEADPSQNSAYRQLKQTHWTTQDLASNKAMLEAVKKSQDLDVYYLFILDCALNSLDKKSALYAYQLAYIKKSLNSYRYLDENLEKLIPQVEAAILIYTDQNLDFPIHRENYSSRQAIKSALKGGLDAFKFSFETSLEKDWLVDFFQEAFQEDNCLEARTTRFQDFLTKKFGLLDSN